MKSYSAGPVWTKNKDSGTKQKVEKEDRKLQCIKEHEKDNKDKEDDVTSPAAKPLHSTDSNDPTEEAAATETEATSMGPSQAAAAESEEGAETVGADSSFSSAAPSVRLEGGREPDAPSTCDTTTTNNNNNNDTTEMRIGVGTSMPGAVNIVPADSGGGREEMKEDTSISRESYAPLDESNSQDLSVPVTAVPVNDPDIERAQLEAEIRNQVLQEAIQADAVALYTPTMEKGEGPKLHQRKSLWLFLLAVLLLVVGLAVGLSMNSSNNNGQDESSPPRDPETNRTFIGTQSTLDRVLDRGIVRCGARENFPGLSYQNADSGKWQGISIDQCRAISIAVFGNPDQYEMVFLGRNERLHQLLEGEVDVLAIFFAWSMASDVFSPSIESGIWFSSPYLFSGFGFVGHPHYIKCADQLDSWSPECRGIKACVVETSVNRDTLQELLPGAHAVLCDTAGTMTKKFVAGECNVVATWPFGSQEVLFRDGGYQGGFVIGEKIFTHEDLSLITRDEDPEWQRIIETVVQTFILAEANNITKPNSGAIKSLFRDSSNSNLAASMESIVAEFGNYGDLYEKHFQQLIPRRGFNLLYNHDIDDSGLLYSLPFRNLDTVGPDPLPNRTLDTILHRGHLNCGVLDSARRTLDIEFCRAIAAAIFAGNKTKLEVMKLSTNATEAMERQTYEALDNGDVDVVAGSFLTLEVLLGEPPFDQHFYAFSYPYFYDTKTMHAFAMMSRADDSQWNSFVFWVAMSIIHAEEEQITQSLWSEMPVTSLFGEELKQCFRDALYAVGNYGEIYSRTLESVMPRSGANQLNADTKSGYGPQHFPILLY